MTSSNPVIRMCVVTRSRKDRTELVKITRQANQWFINNDNKLFGRSIYLDLSETKVIEKFMKQQRRFKIEDDNMEELVRALKILNEEKNAENL